MRTKVYYAACAALLVGLAGPSAAQTSGSHDPAMPHGHGMMQGHDGMQMHGAATADGPAAPREPGQSAFAAIAEIVTFLRSDPKTDWGRVDVEALRRHLIDMDNVTLRAGVVTEPVAGGARFAVASDVPAVTASIRRMVSAHAATMNGADGMEMVAAEIPGGAALTVTGPNAEMIRGLGFVGLMTVGMHHQAHHLAIARGRSPHRH